MLLITARGGGILFSVLFFAAFDGCYFVADKQEEIEGKQLQGWRDGRKREIKELYTCVVF